MSETTQGLQAAAGRPATAMDDVIEAFAQRIREAAARGQPLAIRGSGSKDFYGGAIIGEPFPVTDYSGIIDYEPTELMITARAGSRLADIEAELKKHGQMLAFEPPYFGPDATLGGTVATGLSGPRRATSGAVRDFILGVRILDGSAQDLSFGGRVMKNVAGYDVSRLMAGALGTLGLILDVTLKVLPLPEDEATLAFDLSLPDAIARVNQWGGTPLPMSATAHINGRLYVRLSGAASAVLASVQKLGGEKVADGAAFWASVREQTHPWFTAAGPLWRLSVPSVAKPLALPGEQFMEWGGALRWLKTDADAAAIRQVATQAGGHATLFRSADKSVPVFQPLQPVLLGIHQRLKENFDPRDILNRGRLYPQF